MRFKSRGNDDILSWIQTETLRYFTYVDVRLGAGFGCIIKEEIFWQLLLVAFHLQWQKERVGTVQVSLCVFSKDICTTYITLNEPNKTCQNKQNYFSKEKGFSFVYMQLDRHIWSMASSRCAPTSGGTWEDSRKGLKSAKIQNSKHLMNWKFLRKSYLA